ncbi:MAG TPA: LEA type 2 family protein [Blastocatellia bacterium]|nr:LEA type 2 family protein [Blastocatellia bacterium]
MIKATRIAIAFVIVATHAGAALADDKKPQVTLKSISINKVNLSARTADLIIYLEIENPGAAFNLKDVSYKLRLNGENAAEGKHQKEIKIPARSTVAVDMPLTVNLAAIPAVTWNAITSGFKLHYDLDTEFTVPVFALFNHKVKTAFNGDLTFDAWLFFVKESLWGLFGKP